LKTALKLPYWFTFERSTPSRVVQLSPLLPMIAHEIALEFHVQRKIFRKRLSVGRPTYGCEHQSARYGKAVMNFPGGLNSASRAERRFPSHRRDLEFRTADAVYFGRITGRRRYKQSQDGSDLRGSGSRCRKRLSDRIAQGVMPRFFLCSR